MVRTWELAAIKILKTSPSYKTARREPTIYQCNVCNFGFKQFYLLADHIHWHHLRIPLRRCWGHKPGPDV